MSFLKLDVSKVNAQKVPRFTKILTLYLRIRNLRSLDTWRHVSWWMVPTFQ